MKHSNPTLAHFHDPSLIPIGGLLKLSGIKVVYDVHEDLPRQILSKHWISCWLRRPVSWLAAAGEWVAGRTFDGIVAATPSIARRFPIDKTVTVQNFPILSELVAPGASPYAERQAHFAYVGGITGNRGAAEMVKAVSRFRDDFVRLQLAGNFSTKRDEDAVRALEGCGRVDFHGWVTRLEVSRLLGGARAGLVLFHPLPNHFNAQPTKMFEYMAAGLPVIASDFARWREIVDGAGCGLLVNPLDPDAIAEAMRWLLDHPGEAEAMGHRGRKAVELTYNWEPEAQKLIGLYRWILGAQASEESKNA